jgi:hypothetical protein
MARHKFRSSTTKWFGPAAVIAMLGVAAALPVQAEDAILINPDQMKWVR